MRLDEMHMIPFAFTVSVAKFMVTSRVHDAAKRPRVLAMIEVLHRNVLSVHLIHGEPCSTTFTLTVTVTLCLGDPHPASLVRKNDFRVWKPGTEERIKSIAEKFRKVGEGAHDLLDLCP